MEGKFKNSIKNLIISFGGQLILLVMGIIVPRLILVNYGSEVNGLSNTITQIYTHVALLEAGIGQSALFALYKSRSDKETTDIMSATAYEYRSTGKIYFVCVILLSVLLPLMLKSELSYFTVFSITMLTGIPSLINYYWAASYIQLLTYNGKHYIEATVNLVVTSLSYISKILLANAGVNIVILYVAYFFISLLKTILVILYIKKNYAWIDFKAKKNKTFFQDRKGYIKSQIAWIVFSNTDVILISMFCGLKESSVYAVYSLVLTAIFSLINQIYAGVNFLLGHEYNKSLAEYTVLHDGFDAFFGMLVCSTMTVCYILLLPFVRLYTAGITDANYLDPLLPLLFCAVQILTWSRYVSGNLTSLAGFANKIGKISVIEAIINVALTTVFIPFWGIRGALLGTIIALLFKANYLTVFANKVILKRSNFNSYRIWVSNILFFGLFVIITYFYRVQADNYVTLFVIAVIVSLIAYSCFYLMNLAVNHKETMLYTGLLIRKIRSAADNFKQKKASCIL